MVERKTSDEEGDGPVTDDGDEDAMAAISWPLDAHKQRLLAQLAGLIARHGAARFVEAPLVRPDARDFPDPWSRTLPALRRLLERLFWHAYLDVELVLKDARAGRSAEQAQLLDSDIDVIDAANGRAVFQVTAIGNDDVAGLLAHRVGLAFVKLSPGAPFREARLEPTAADGTLAAIYLGLGVLAANSAIYHRHASELVGRTVQYEYKVATAGGLNLDDVTFLLAIQDVVREESQRDALGMLSEVAAEWFQAWAAALEPHRAELRAALALDDAPAVPLSRAAVPVHHLVSSFNAGRDVYRLPHSIYDRILVGAVLGLLGFFAGPGVGCLTTIAGLSGGYLATPRCFRCSHRDCGCVMRGKLDTCPGCGGTIVNTVDYIE